eukprot:gb/GEZN01017847.1/.p1 GENE.gb/GEZN01017847.1/~~gb/GEZN01017847.1/.p1  ORF type:complete len:188 (-),score=46.32 gb/GEZN01017847.1/:109-672(-)
MLRLQRLTTQLTAAPAAQMQIRHAFAAAATLKVGDKLPSVPLMENEPGTLVDPSKVFAKGKHVLFGVPGAFTPGCSKTHLPGYVSQAAAFKAKGVDSISCVSVNDVFVMKEWGIAHKADGKVRMLADPAAAFVKAAGLEVDATKVLGNVRSKRWAMVLDGGKVKQLEVEADGFGLSCSLADKILGKL